MPKLFLLTGSIFAATAVALGAFGAHALKTKLSAEQLQIFETGVRYQFYHSLALILIFLIQDKINSQGIYYSGILISIGIILFSGSLYFLASRDLLGIEGWKNFLGPVTPIGGLCFIGGWICLIIAAYKS